MLLGQAIYKLHTRLKIKEKKKGKRVKKEDPEIEYVINTAKRDF